IYFGEGPKLWGARAMPHSSGLQKASRGERGLRPPLRVGVILAEHFTLSAFAVFIDHLRLAADEGDRSRPLHVQWSIMASRQASVPASCEVMIDPTSRSWPTGCSLSMARASPAQAAPERLRSQPT